jgi:hypothetical protein
MGVPRVAGTGSTLGKGGLSAPIPVLRPGYRVIAERWPFFLPMWVLGGEGGCVQGARNRLTRLVGRTRLTQFLTDAVVYNPRCRPI